MPIANIQAQIANLTSQLSQHIERTSMQSVPTFGYPVYQQGWESDNTWSDHSNTMWWEPQQAQHEAYWQPHEEFYLEPMPPPQQFQSGSLMACDHDELISLMQGSQNQAKEAQQEGYWQPYEEFYESLCSHLNLPLNNSKQTQVRQWIMITFLMY